MRTAATWPDRSTYSAVVLDPARCFGDAELSTATMARGRRGVLAWSGGRAIVFQAVCPDGRSVAVRFLLSPDPAAGARYAALERHLAAYPVEALVRARWLDDGVRIEDSVFPMLKMDWVSGKPVDQYVAQTIEAGAASAPLGELARDWRHTCQLLTRARVGHGDIHAGNVMVAGDAGAAPALRLVDYDNVWVPGLSVASGEQGHPSFQHPHRVIGGTGPSMDAFPNTLMYLSLRALAAEPALWAGFHRGDDMLLFHRDDLVALDSQVWARLARSPDPIVAALAHLTRRWLESPCEQYAELEQALEAARPAPPLPSPQVWNQWRAGPNTAATGPGGPEQVWPAEPVPPPPSPPTVAPPGAHRRRWLVVLVLLLALVVLVAVLS